MSRFDYTTTTSLKRKLDFTSTSSPTPLLKDQSTLPPSPRVIQFFVRLFSGKTVVLTAKQNDTVSSIHHQITTLTKIPSLEQRLIYKGKQLQSDQTLDECCLVNDSILHLVARLKSTRHPRTRHLLDNLVTLIFRFCQFGPNSIMSSVNCSLSVFESSEIQAVLNELLGLFRKDNDVENCRIFVTSLAPLALVMLYTSVIRSNRAIVRDAVNRFVSGVTSLSNVDTWHCAVIVLEFCKLLRSRVGMSDGLYVFCRDSLGRMIGGNGRRGDDVDDGLKDLIDIREFVPFISEFAVKLSCELVLSMCSEPFAGVSSIDVDRFSGFVHAVRSGRLIKLGTESGVGSSLPKENNCEYYDATLYDERIKMLHYVFKDLMGKMDWCLEKMQGVLAMDDKESIEQMSCRWNKYLAILKGLNGIAKVLEGAEELFWGTFKKREVSLSHLIFKFAERTDDHDWILVQKVVNFEARRHLFMMMFPVVEDVKYQMWIDRTRLLEESFAQILHAEIEALHSGLFIEFKNEEATGSGVLREWFNLVCQEIFNPQNPLFVACPNDRRRFFPNPVSKVDPLHLEYFTFSGRFIALALMHNIQVGIVFDRVFFVQMAGKKVSLEDICDADPYLHNSCKKILEMDADMVDHDDLGLTFVREVYELGTRKVVELCAGGKNISVTSRNRKDYVDLLIQHSFVTSIAEQVAHFVQGFSDVFNDAHIKVRVLLQKSFFENIDLEEFDWMLYGSESALSLEDWMAHTKYVGFKETDPQICWFWKIVGDMPAEQRRSFLFFWTSIKYLPVEGFRGLGSPLYICLTYESLDHLPSSSTCFYRLCFPPYPSEEIMQDRLQIITREHVGRSFGVG